MPLVEIEVTLKIDGQLVDGFPIVRRLNPAEEVHNRISKPNGDGASYFTLSRLAIDNVLIVQTDTSLNLRLNGQTNGQITLNAGGLLLLIDGLLNFGSVQNVTVNNQAAQAANILAVEVGP